MIKSGGIWGGGGGGAGGRGGQRRGCIGGLIVVVAIWGLYGARPLKRDPLNSVLVGSAFWNTVGGVGGSQWVAVPGNCCSSWSDCLCCQASLVEVCSTVTISSLHKGIRITCLTCRVE